MIRRITNVEREARTDPANAGLPGEVRPISPVSLTSLSDADLALMLRFLELLAKWEQRGRSGN